jgi:phosphoserine phosphatase RsbU/P
VAEIETLAPPPAVAGAGSCTPEEALTCLLAITHDLSVAPDLATGLTNFASGLARFLPYRTLGVLLLDDLGRELHFELAVGFSPAVASHWRFGLGQGVIGTAAQTGQTVAVPKVEEDARYIAAGVAVGSELAIPLKVKGRTIGVLDVGRAEPGGFTPEQERLLTTLADHLAVAIESARLYQNTREQARSLSLLHEISRELMTLSDRRELLVKVARRLRRLIDYDLFSALIWNPEAEQLESWLTVDREGLEIGRLRPVPLGHGLCGTAAALRQPIRVPNVHLDSRYLDCSGQLEVASELVVPLVLEDRLLGVLNLESTRFDAFSPHHEQFLSTLASSLAMALENARLYERLRDNERRIEQDLVTAREIQKQLLPASTPWIPDLQFGVGYEPARYLGGDFYDFLRRGDGRVAIAVGDVAGKATPAALYGSLAMGMLREVAGGERAGPAATLAVMNAKLGALGVGNRFLALAFAVYDDADRSLTLANSGLPHPFLVREGSVSVIPVAGVPLGLLPDRRYEEVRIELAPGDSVILCSDGIEETLDPEGRELGGERVIAELTRLAASPPQELADSLLEACRAFAGDAEPSDDRTVVVIRLAAGASPPRGS